MSYGLIIIVLNLLISVCDCDEVYGTPPVNVMKNGNLSTTPSKPPGGTESNDDQVKGNIIFIAAGCGAGFVILVIILVVCCWCCKKKRLQNENLMHSPRFSKTFEKDVINQYQSHLRNSVSDSALENKGFMGSPSKSKFYREMKTTTSFVAKPYGDIIGKAAASPFIGASHNHRLCSITSATSLSSISDSIPFMNKDRLSDIMIERAKRPSVSIGSEESLQARRNSSYANGSVGMQTPPRRDSGYENVNDFKPLHSKVSNGSTGKQITYPKSSGYLTHELNMPKPKGRAHSNIDTRETGPSPETEVVRHRHASTGQALTYTKQEEKEYQNSLHDYASLKREITTSGYDEIAKGGDYEVPVDISYETFNTEDHENRSCSTGSEDDHDYTDLTQYDKGYSRNGYIVPVKKSQEELNQVEDYSVAYHLSSPPKKYLSMLYEVPEGIVASTNGSMKSSEYSNIDIEQNQEYANFDYEVPRMNPTQTDSEDVYVEFIPE